MVDDPAVSEFLNRRVPLQRWGAPTEIGGAAVFLASHAASSFVTGTDLRVDGGFLSTTI